MNGTFFLFSTKTASVSTGFSVRSQIGLGFDWVGLEDPARSASPCVGCDIVQADHAPEAGVAQGIFHGILVRHHGRNQEAVEEDLRKK